MSGKADMLAEERARVHRIRDEARSEGLWLLALFLTVASSYLVGLAVEARKERLKNDEISPFIYTMW
ncbi:MAG TPA: hypothetical protein ENI79_04800 [Rhodospirillales bacterium]|nr:hypothetical protein [Rhodospirillales bacterium]